MCPEMSLLHVKMINATWIIMHQLPDEFHPYNWTKWTCMKCTNILFIPYFRNIQFNFSLMKLIFLLNVILLKMFSYYLSMGVHWLLAFACKGVLVLALYNTDLNSSKHWKHLNDDVGEVLIYFYWSLEYILCSSFIQ